MNHSPSRMAVVVAVALLSGSRVHAQPAQSVSVAPESPRWELEGQAKAAEYQGRKCLSLDGGAATLKDLEMRDGVIDVDVATPASRGFFGIDFRLKDNGAVLAVSELGGGWGFICRLTDPES